MTMQVTDSVLLRSQQYALLGKSGGSLFDPETYGITPVSTNSTNWRGFSCQFAIQEGSLFLDSVSANVILEDPNPENIPLLLGKSAEVSWLSDRFKAAGIPIPTYLAAVNDVPMVIYTDIGAFLPYTGALLLAKDWEDSDYDLDRYQHRACHYADVREILLREGRVIEEYDRSSAIAAIRETMLTMSLGEQYNQRQQIREQIGRCFLPDQEYDYRY